MTERKWHEMAPYFTRYVCPFTIYNAAGVAAYTVSIMGNVVEAILLDTCTEAIPGTRKKLFDQCSRIVPNSLSRLMVSKLFY